MATVSLPDRPSLDQLRNQARDLQRAVRGGDPEAAAHAAEHGFAGSPRFPLSTAQAVVARHYGFASWPRLVRHLELLDELTREPDTVGELDDPAAEFLRLACLTYGEDDPERHARARRLLAARPEVARADIFTAAAVADADEVSRRLTVAPAQARARGGPHRWAPLLYLAYARHDPDVTSDAVLATARALLDAGADPDDGYLWHGLTTPFTVLTGVFGSGEGGPVAQPRHPHDLAFARLLLEAGADPNDGQTLYNRMFRPDDSHLELLFEFGLGTGDGGPWRARLGPAGEAPASMLASQLWWAITHDMVDRVRLLLAHGVDADGRWRDGRRAVEWAAISGRPAIVALLVEAGAPPPALDPVDELVAAVRAADRAAVARLRSADPAVVDAARARRPGLVVAAAATGRMDAVEVVVDLGFDVNALGRADAPIEQEWETALHEAAGTGNVALARYLLDHGADPDIHDCRFDAPPLGWARHFGQAETEGLLEPITTW